MSTKIYTYIRVSTNIQEKGFSLDAQAKRLKDFADYKGYEIANTYVDAGKSGKSVLGRPQFLQMIEDIKTKKDDISYVVVFKLSRFGRNAADVLSTLRTIQEYGANLICVEEGIDSSQSTGKLLLTILSAIAELERETIRVQTMEGRYEKARQGEWNGGQAPYGYQIVGTNKHRYLEINEDEAPIIRMIFEKYAGTDMGSSELSTFLAASGIRKIPRKNSTTTEFSASLIRRIIANPIYYGMMPYARRITTKVAGTENEYHKVCQENYQLTKGKHKPIVTEELWKAANVKLEAQANRYQHATKGRNAKVHLLTNILCCPVCGEPMGANVSIKRKPDGTRYKDYFYYQCKHKTLINDKKCPFNKQVKEDLVDNAVSEVISKAVNNPEFAAIVQQKIQTKIDTTALDAEIERFQRELQRCYKVKNELSKEIDALDPDDRHYNAQKADLQERLYAMYDNITDAEELLTKAMKKKEAVEAAHAAEMNIFKLLESFESAFLWASDVQRRTLVERLISKVEIYPERNEHGQWLKAVDFKLPIVSDNTIISLNDGSTVEASGFRRLIRTREAAIDSGEPKGTA